MRAAEYGLDGSSGSTLTVFYFGPGQGGDVRSNVDRWVGQFSQPDGSPSQKRAEIATRQNDGIKITTVKLNGIFNGGMGRPGSQAQPSKELHGLLGAIAEGPSGPVFFKLTGPAADIQSASAAFDAMLNSLAVGP